MQIGPPANWMLPPKHRAQRRTVSGRRRCATRTPAGSRQKRHGAAPVVLKKKRNVGVPKRALFYLVQGSTCTNQHTTSRDPKETGEPGAGTESVKLFGRSDNLFLSWSALLVPSHPLFPLPRFLHVANPQCRTVGILSFFFPFAVTSSLLPFLSLRQSADLFVKQHS